MRITARQQKVLDNLSLVKSDGARVYAQYKLGEESVSVQVRSLIRYGLIDIRGERLVAIDRPVPAAPATIDTDAAVSAMRNFLSE